MVVREKQQQLFSVQETKVNEKGVSISKNVICVESFLMMQDITASVFQLHFSCKKIILFLSHFSKSIG